VGTFTLSHLALTISAATALLTGCGGSQPRSGAKTLPLSRAAIARMNPPPPCFAGLDKWQPTLQRWRCVRQSDKVLSSEKPVKQHSRATFSTRDATTHR